MKTISKFSSKSTSKSTTKQNSFYLSSDLNRPPVNVDAEVQDSVNFAKAMLALRRVVISDKRPVLKDYSRYQKWVFQEYMKELGEKQPKNIELIKKTRKAIKNKLSSINKEIKKNPITANDKGFRSAQKKFWDWLYRKDKDLWYILDPVISVQPECVIFEAFSIDESSYGRVTLPKKSLKNSKKYSVGTTNIDFTNKLANEFKRIRSYRPLKLKIGQDNVKVSSGFTENIEKKIDLPQSWVNGFLEVQTASTLQSINVELSPSYIADIIAYLENKKNNVSPKSLKIKLQNGQKPIIEIEPWGKELKEHKYIYEGKSKNIRLWGRSRLSILKDILKIADKVQLRLFGDGMPSFWSCVVGEITFDLCLSGWTANDWSSQIKFAMLASDPLKILEKDDCRLTNRLKNIIEKDVVMTLDSLVKHSQADKKSVLGCMQRLCSKGLVMYDFHTDTYRWRELFNMGDKLKISKSNKNLEKGLSWEFEEGEVYSVKLGEGQKELNYISNSLRRIESSVIVNRNGSIEEMKCNCFDFKKTSKKNGPCKHLIALMNKEIWSKDEYR